MCGSGESQLGAYVTGGTGNYTFQWEPLSGLDDPESQFPVAEINLSSIYSVQVDDGIDTFDSEIAVSSFPEPSTPVIIQQGDSLISDISEGNQWYSSEGNIEGATGQIFYPASEDDYFNIIFNENNCASDTSNIIHFIFTEIAENENNFDILFYPNPVKETLHIRNTSLAKPAGNIHITDVTGRILISINISYADFQDDISISLQGLNNGLYLCYMRNPEGKLLVSKKLIKF